MDRLTVKDIEKYKDNYDIVPICTEVYADVVTPISLLRKIARAKERYYLLESIEGGEKWGRYSFLGYDPILRTYCDTTGVSADGRKKSVGSDSAYEAGTGSDNKSEKILPIDGDMNAPTARYRVTIDEHGQKRVITTDDTLTELRKILADYKAPKIEGIPPFAGGFVGYFSYAMIEHAEPTLDIARGLSHDFDLMLYDKVIAYDHLKQKIVIVVNVSTHGDIDANLNKAYADMQGIIRLIRDDSPLPQIETYSNVNFSCDVTEEEYAKMVEKTRDYIYDGDIFQAVISRRFESDYKGSLINPYRVLRTTNPSPYMVYMNLDDVEIMSTSPETLVRLNDGRLVTFPVAGSRPRGKDEEEDLTLEKDLMSDEKELSEHNMLVDLGRNDLGRLSKFGSVEVTKYQMIHRYSKIMHICSQVEGDIRDDKDALDAIAAVLPAGTLSGAPKIRACEIIDELEVHPRGIYGGALGYVDFTGNMDTCIAIRMAVHKDDKVYVQAGGGIVADSVPTNEYQESANKAKAVMQAIEMAGEVE